MTRTQGSTDVVIVGGGIGGSGLAAVLQQGGLQVTVLERTTEFPDRVRGEIYVAWGVALAQELGLLQPLLDAGAEFSTRWVFYDPAIPTEVAESMAVDATAIVPGVAGFLNFTHPAACNALFAHAARAGAAMHRGVTSVELDLGADKSIVRWKDESGSEHETGTTIVVGADGRNSTVRRQCGIELEAEPVRHYMTGLLVEGQQPIRRFIDSQGTNTDTNWYAFPQGPRCARVYLTHFDPHRYTGPEAVTRFLADLAECASPDIASLATGHALTPIATHPSINSWTEEPFCTGAVLIGDAAGYNDPIIGQGLSLAMADVRDVSRVLLKGGRSPQDFAAYATARRDRHAKLRLASHTMAELMCSFGKESAERRLRALPLMESAGMALAAAMLAGPEVLPPGLASIQAAREAMLSA